MMEIQTQRLTMKPITESDLDNLTALLTDETVKQGYMVPDFPSREEARKLAARLADISREGQRFVVGIFLENTLIGLMNETEVLGDRIELGYAILPQFQNRGFCTEALEGAIGYCFSRGFRQVITGAFEENAASIRVMMKNGMRPIHRRDTIEYRGKTHLCVYYAIEK